MEYSHPAGYGTHQALRHPPPQLPGQERGTALPRQDEDEGIYGAPLKDRMERNGFWQAAHQAAQVLRFHPSLRGRQAGNGHAGPAGRGSDG